MVVHLVHVFVVRILVGDAHQVFLTQSQVVEFILEDHTRMEESVADDGIAGCLLFLRKRYLCQIVLSIMGVASCLCLLFLSLHLGRVLHHLFTGLRHTGGIVTLCRIEVHDGLVHTLPVVGIRTLTPQSLESSLSLVDGHRVVEVPLSVALLYLRSWR